MSVAQQLASRQAFTQLTTQPLHFLQNTALTSGGYGGNDTYVDNALEFSLHNGRATLGTPAFQITQPAGSVIHQLGGYVTPMRSNVIAPGRLAATARFGTAAGPSLWTTTRQTGCSVLLLDWGGTLSMVHLQPFTPNAFNRVASYLMSKSDYAKKEIIRNSLQWEMSSVIQNSSAGATPQQYILVQSNWRAHYLGVTGVRLGGIWTFYLQTYDNVGTVHSCAPLAWTAWHSWGPFVASAY